MRTFYTFILGTIIYVLFFVSLLSSIESNKSRHLLFFYPNGYIMHTNSDNLHLVGYNVIKESKLPGINIVEDLYKDTLLEIDFYSNYKTLYAFLPILLLSYFLFISSLLFLIRIGDTLFFFFFFITSLFLISNVFLLGFDQYYSLFYTTLFQLGFLIFHLGFRIKGIDVPTKWYVPEIAFSIVLATIGANGGNSPELFDNLMRIASIILLTSSSALFAVAVYDQIKYRNWHNTDWTMVKKMALSFSLVGTVFFYYFALKFDWVKSNNYVFWALYLVLYLFPFIFISSSYGLSYIPQQLLFTSVLSLLYQLLFLIFTYSLSFVLLYKALPEDYISELYIYYPIPFLLIIILFGSNIKVFIATKIEDLTFGRDRKLNETLDTMVNWISSPAPIKRSVKHLIQKVSDALEVEKVIILVSGERYRNIDFEGTEIMKLPHKSATWEYFCKEDDATITSYLSYGSGTRRDVYNFLHDLKIQIAYPIYGIENQKTPTSVFLVGEKKNKKNFSIGELRFIKECTRLGDMILQNYLLLVSDIEKKRMEKDIYMATLQQKTMNTLLDWKNIEDIEMGHISIPALGVSGDYLDYIKTDHTLKIFLGDVSGHGVGSGYLVSAVKALTREQISMGLDLEKLFKNLNTFLLARHSGNQFMSLIGAEYNLIHSTFEFINAGHLHPILLRKDGTIEYLRTPDRVLGVLPTGFHRESVNIYKGDRLVIFSDGVTETFNPSEEIFGISRLEKIVREKADASSMDLINAIIDSLNDFRKGADLTDDISLICLTRK